MSKENIVTDEDIERAVVRLKPLFGLSPGRWLAILIGIVLVAVLFLFLVLPGLLRSGTVYRFTSAPAGAAVFVDGAYRGATPCAVFIRTGDHAIKVSRRYFGDEDLSRSVKGRVFASLWFPRRESLSCNLPLSDGEGLWRAAVREFSSWTLAGDPSSIWQAPPVLESAAAARFADGSNPAPSWEERRDFVLASARLAANGESAKECIRAATLVFGSGNPESPDAAEGWRRILTQNPELAALLFELAPAEARTLPGADEAKAASEVVPERSPASPRALRTFPRTVGGARFLPVSGSDASVILLAETETTVEQYAAFLKDNPQWAPNGKDRLVGAGLATKDYLSNYEKTAPDGPVSGVSWYAATAYCEWLSRFAPEGYRVALPSEAQWERAALVGGGTGAQVWEDGARTSAVSARGRNRDAAGFADLLGNLWEWCEDSYSPHPGIGLEASERFPGSERSVRGGCWANARGSVSESTRGSFPPAWCSVFLGFRAALIARSMKD